MATLEFRHPINELFSGGAAFGPFSENSHTHRYKESKSANLPSRLPYDFPTSISTERALYPHDLRERGSFIVHFTKAQICEIENGLSHFLGLHQTLDHVSQETFPLPTLATKLEKIALDVHFGSGFIILRGLNPNKYSVSDNLLIYLGITSYVADERGRQDSDGNMLIHIKDYHSGNERQAPFSNRAIEFHNDQCDILAMYMLSKAAEGGNSQLASSGEIYNIIASTRPDLISALAEPSWPFLDLRNPSQWVTRPLLYNFPGHGPAFCFNKRHLTKFGPDSGGISDPRLTALQLEALELVEKTARDNALSVSLEPGDIQLLNNFSFMHARAAFTDHTERCQRHLWRLWLRNSRLAWEKPGNLEIKSWSAYEVGMGRQKWPVDPKALTTERISRRNENCS